MQGRAERVARGTLIGSASVVLAAAGHGVAGGGTPGWLALAVGVVAASLVGALLVGRRPSLPRTAAVVLLGQAGFHYLFSGLGGAGVAISGHVHSATVPLPGTDGSTSGGSTTGAAQHADHLAHLADPRMLAAHALAALVTLVLLRHAEAAVWRMLRRALARILRLPDAPVPSHPAPRTAVVGRRRIAPRLTAHPPPPRRGPPLLSFS